MSGYPIMFSRAMVQALVAGTKSQTRRIMKQQPGSGVGDGASGFFCPFGDHGDLLYVREEFRFSSFYKVMTPSQVPPEAAIHYEADNPLKFSSRWGKLRDNMYMPRCFSRITLELVDVRVERLNDISDQDCIAEGISLAQMDIAETYMRSEKFPETMLRGGSPARWAYAKLWEDLHGRGSWQANPFVWMLEFETLHTNIDELLQERGDA